MHRKIDISIDFDHKTNEVYFFIPIDHLIDDDPLIKTIRDKGFWPSASGDINVNLNNLFIDTTRLQHSSIRFNQLPATSCIPNPTAEDTAKEYEVCLSKFDGFLERQFRLGKNNLLKHYQQGLINFPGNVLFQALKHDGHTLRGKVFEAEISCSADDNLPIVTSKIQDLKYTPNGKDPFDDKDVVSLPGYLKTKMQFFMTNKKSGFNVTVHTKSPAILALILGEFHNKRYINFLENFKKVKKTTYLLSKEISVWLKKIPDPVLNLPDDRCEKSLNKFKADVKEIESIFEKTTWMHANLDLLLALQDRSLMSPKKLDHDIRQLEVYHRELYHLAKSFRTKQVKVDGLIEYRSQWFSTVRSSMELMLSAEGTLNNLQKYPDLNSMPW